MFYFICFIIFNWIYIFYDFIFPWFFSWIYFICFYFPFWLEFLFYLLIVLFGFIYWLKILTWELSWFKSSKRERVSFFACFYLLLVFSNIKMLQDISMLAAFNNSKDFVTVEILQYGIIIILNRKRMAGINQKGVIKAGVATIVRNCGYE